MNPAIWHISMCSIPFMQGKFQSSWISVATLANLPMPAWGQPSAWASSVLFRFWTIDEKLAVSVHESPQDNRQKYHDAEVVLMSSINSSIWNFAQWALRTAWDAHMRTSNSAAWCTTSVQQSVQLAFWVNVFAVTSLGSSNLSIMHCAACWNLYSHVAWTVLCGKQLRGLQEQERPPASLPLHMLFLGQCIRTRCWSWMPQTTGKSVCIFDICCLLGYLQGYEWPRRNWSNGWMAEACLGKCNNQTSV